MAGSDDLQRWMNDVVSVRRWEAQPVTPDELEPLLTAFGLAPSSTQPWEILQLNTPEVREAAVLVTLEPLMTPGTEGAQSWLLKTPVVLAVCVELRRAAARTGEQGRRHALQEVGGAIQNLRLMARSLGLRTAVVREFAPQRMAEALGLPWYLEPVALVGVGRSTSHLEYPPKLPITSFWQADYALPAGRVEGTPPAVPAPARAAAPAPAPVIPAIYRRRSARRFRPEPLPAAAREQLLQAAVQAPSGGNMQPWEFIVLEDPAVRDAVVATTYAGYFAGPDNKQAWLADAPLLMAVCCNIRRTEGRYGNHTARQAVLDVAAAIQNLLITATELGLGGCWVGGFREEALAAVLQIPPGVDLVGLVAIGWPAEHPGPRHRMPLSHVTHRDRWGAQYYTDYAQDSDQTAGLFNSL